MSENITRIINEPAFLDLEINIGGMKYMYSKTLLSIHSDFIYKNVITNQRCGMFISVPNIPPDILKEFLDWLQLRNLEPAIKLKVDTVQSWMIAEYLEIWGIPRISIETRLKEEPGRIIKEFIENYEFPFTDFPGELKVFLTHPNFERIKDKFHSLLKHLRMKAKAGNEIAAIFQLAFMTNIIDWEKMEGYLDKFEFPPDFLLKMIRMDSISEVYSIEPIVQRSSVELQIHKKRKGFETKEIDPLRQKIFKKITDSKKGCFSVKSSLV